MKLKNKSGSEDLGSFSGIVYAHLGRGKKLGYPTANVRLNKKLSPGVYVSQTTVGDRIFPSVTFIGKPTTFNDPEERAETHILDQRLELVGEHITVRLLQHIRENKKFESVEKLIQAIKQDESQARSFFAA